jgi:hypothetical protein
VQVCQGEIYQQSRADQRSSRSGKYARCAAASSS